MIAATIKINGNEPADDKAARLLHRFANAAKAHHSALESMDAERADVHARMLTALHAALLCEGESGREKLLSLVDSVNPAVAGMAAVYALGLDPERCLTTLRRVAMAPGLLGFRASIAIERWESGEWEK